jgi:hypothetical protein
LKFKLKELTLKFFFLNKRFFSKQITRKIKPVKFSKQTKVGILHFKERMEAFPNCKLQAKLRLLTRKTRTLLHLFHKKVKGKRVSTI